MGADSLYISHDQPVSKTMYALSALRSSILSGEVAPGARFDVRTLATQLNMSVTPIREALRILQADGLVTYDEYRAMSVADLSNEDADEIFLIRSMLEPVATERAARLADEADRERLKSAHEQMVAACATQDAGKIRAANMSWHFMIYQAGRTTYLEQMIARVWAAFDWQAVWTATERSRASVQEHEAIMAALMQGDGTAAAEAMRAHIIAGFEAVSHVP
jgi:DNA-binding GntR family transcriptional regulator